MDTIKKKDWWIWAMIDQALDLFKEEAMAEIFNGLEEDLDYQEHWLLRQIGWILGVIFLLFWFIAYEIDFSNFNSPYDSYLWSSKHKS